MRRNFELKEVESKRSLAALLLATALFFASQATMAEEVEKEKIFDLGEVIVTATKTEEREAHIGSSTTVITSEEIERQGKKEVLEVLRDIPGIALSQNGPFGGSTSLYLRGSKPGHTLVMIDGVEVNDPMSTDRSFDFAHLTTDNIERVEVVRGPQSTLWGSDAMGGVINIITKKGEGKPKINLFSEAGSHGTFRESVSLSAGTEKLSYSVSMSRIDSDGISKAADGEEADSYENTTLSSRIGLKVLDNAELNLNLRHTEAHTDIDDGSYEDDPNYVANSETVAFRLEFDQSLNRWWDHKLSLSFLDMDRDNRDEKDSVDTTEYMYDWYKGDSRKFEWQNNFHMGEVDTLTCGFEYEDEKGSSHYRLGTYTSEFERKEIETKSAYLQNRFGLWDRFFTTVGIRYDDHELFGSQTTYKASAAYLIWKTGTRLKASWGTGFNAPSLYQLYSSYGDPELDPEECEAYDFGFEQSLLDGRATLRATYFRNDFEDMIEYDLTANKYKNIGRAETRGEEVEVSFRPIEDLTILANYTHLYTEDKETGKELLRRPTDQASLNLNWRWLEKGNLNLGVTYIGERADIGSVTLDKYTKVDFSLGYDIKENFQIFGRAENIFDEDYEEIYGYGTPGVSFYGGFKLGF